MRLLDTTSNEVIDIANAENPDSVIPGLLSGQVAPDLDALYKIKMPDGNVADVGGGELESYLKSGSTFYSKADTLKAAEEERFASVPQQLAAGALGVGRGLSLGLSDQALTKTGLISPEYLQKQEEYNPEAGIAGEVAGAVIPAVLSGGNSLAAKALQYTPAGLVGAAGKAIGAASAPLAEMAGARVVSPIAKKAIAKATEMGLGSAAEGALYGGGKAVSENAIYNKPLTAEALLSDIGTGAIVGGLTGGLMAGGIEAAGGVAKKGLEKLGGFIEGKGEKLESMLVARGLGTSKRNMGAILGSEFKQEAINDAYKAIMSNVDEIGAGGSFADDFAKASETKLGLDSITKNNDELLADTVKLKQKAGDTISSSVEKIQGEVNTNTIIKAIEDAGDEIGKVDFANRDKLKNFSSRLKEELSDMDALTGELVPRDMTGKDLWEFRKQLDDVIYDDQIISNGQKSAYGKALEKARGEIEGKLEELAKSQGDDLFKEYKAAKNAYSGAADIERLIIDQNKKNANNLFGLTAYDTAAAGAVVGGAPGAAIGFVGRKLVADYGDKAALYVLSQLEKKASSFNKILDDTVGGLMGAASKGGTVTSIVSQKTDKDQSHEEKIKELDNQLQKLDEIKDGLNKGLGELGMAAPETAMQVRDKTLNALDFLSSKAPKRPEANPLVKYQVPESEIDKFNRYVVAVEQPKTILSNLKGGYISPEEIEVLKKVYPEMHAQLKNKVIGELAKKGKDINYQQRLQLQKLLETKSDVNLYPTSIKTLQQTFQPASQVNQQQQQQQTPARMPGSRAKSLNLGSKMTSGLESTLRRRNS